ncbi:hypothetical protein [Streptococcus loxodontisalivarius]|uniref:Uncharacterized protein n=1 Tax=Streptococcus loxodontisalivarius TaxID=1349415 RepID=A0ABS2PV54_9STRE|nr:hypothetical protein [Streptococcus loxodontisalivarius]MBM7643761.1 hypothetical protein [Streptococcus loxodontisalivarius]
MHEKDLKKVLSNLRQKYVERPADSQETVDQETLSSRKIAKIKQKMVGLEMERCQLMMDRADLTSVDEKIAKQKSLYKKCCQKVESRG